MFRPLCVGHLQVEIQLTDQLYRMCGRLSGDWVGGKGGGRDLVVSIVLYAKYQAGRTSRVWHWARPCVSSSSQLVPHDPVLLQFTDNSSRSCVSPFLS